MGRSRSIDRNTSFLCCLILIWMVCVCVFRSLPAYPQSTASRDKTAPAATTEGVAKQSSQKEHAQFTRGNAGELQTKEGTHLDFIDYWASDGVSVRMLYTNVDAQQAFDREIAQATKVVKRGSKLDSNGRIVGERAQVLLSPLQDGHSFFAVIWTDGAKFHEIRSRSLRHILELEKVYRY